MNSMKTFIIPLLVIALVAFAISTTMKEETVPTSQIPDNAKEAIFAGGCFWCNEASFEAIEGVYGAVSGYTGGDEEDPTYQQVASGQTGHRESVKVFYNPEVITYRKLIDFFWRQIDPTDPEGQFVDKGHQYTTAIYYQTPEEKQAIEESKVELENSGRFDKPVVTEILPLKKFYDAEEYHQDYYKKKVLNYKIYEAGSGRKQFKENNWNENI